MTPKHPLGHLSISPGKPADVAREAAEVVQRGEKAACVPVNVTKYAMARSDPKLRRAINEAAFAVADGLPIVWLARRAGYRDVARITGIGLAEDLLAEADREGWRVFLLGASPENLESALGALRQRFGRLQIAGSHHGYFETADAGAVLQAINATQPDLLLLGMGLPQKEYFVVDHFREIEARLVLAVGGAFDVWAGIKKRAPVAIQKIGLEWAYRSLYDLGKARKLARHAAVFLKDLALYRAPKRSA